MLDQELLPYIDLEGGLKRIRGNKAFYCKMVRLFLDGGENAAFEDCLAANDIARASDMAHGMKGLAGNLSFTKLYELSAKLNVQLREGVRDEETLAQYRDTFIKTRECAERVINELV